LRGKRVTHDTPRGMLTIRSYCPPGFFSGLKVDGGIGNFSHYSSIIQKIDVFERTAQSKDGNVTLALLDEGLIVGYVACWYPAEGERWRTLDELMYEMGALEVSRTYRHMHLARRIMDVIMDDAFFEEKIAYMNGFSWHWDLDGTGLTMAEYRRMMINLLRPYGFREYPTNEPNIAIRQENIYMARIGSRVSERDQRRFRNLLFGIEDERL
jgi:acetoin utilization protein AcuA